MSKRWGIRRLGWPLSAVLGWCQRTAGRYTRFAGAVELRMVGRENGSEGARSIDYTERRQVDFGGELGDFKQFIKFLRIGDRVRVFCDDGVIEAEKISPERYKLIYAVETTGAIH